MEIVSANIGQRTASAWASPWSTDAPRPADLFVTGARNFECRHGAGITELIREVFEEPTGVSAGAEGRWAGWMAILAFSRFLLTDSGPGFVSLSALDHEPVPPRRTFTISAQIMRQGRPPALPIE
jgi:hypothetical protein